MKNDFPYTIRTYRLDDFDSYLRLNVEARKFDSPGYCVLPQTLSERMGMPGYFPEQDMFVAEQSGELLGYIDITQELSIGRVVLDCLIHPEHRRNGLARELTLRAIQHTMELGAQVAHVQIAASNVAATSLLSKLGFRFIRCFLEQTLLLPELNLPNFEQFVPLCRQLQFGEEGKLTELQNRSFAGSWGFNPNTIEEIVYRINQYGCSPGDVILVDEADEPIGYCWTTIAHQEYTLSTGKGRIYMLGVDPECRGRRMGKLLLSAGLSYLKDKGIDVVDLTVDSQNTSACALYESAGFRVSSMTLWYEKELD